MRYFPALLTACAIAAVTVPIAHYDNAQTGANTAETTITPANVSRLHKFGTWTTTGFIFAQPLIVPAVNGKDLLIVAGLDNKVYAFDANNPGVTIWSKSFGTPRGSYPGNSGTFTFAYSQALGILSTPYVDTANGFVYICAEDSTPQYTAYKLNLSDGTTVASKVIAGSVSGTGDPAGGDCVSGGVLSFCASSIYIQRPGLVVSNGKLYLTFGGTDLDPWHGWIFALNTSDFSTAGIFCTTRNGAGASVWMPGSAPTVDASGNLYIVTGNGDYDGAANFGESIIKLSPTLAVLDWFTPANWATLNSNDSDFGSNHFTLIPGTTKGMIAAKDYSAFLIDTACMGHLQGSSGCSLQTFSVCNACFVGKTTGGYSQIFMNGVWYLATTGQDADSFGGAPAGSLYAFTFSSGAFNTTPAATNIVNAWPFPGPSQIAGSSNGATNQIIWAVTGETQTFTLTTAGTLRAFGTNLTELWNSGILAGDALGLMSKYTAPTIANGRVYVSTQSNQVVGFKLTPNSQISGQVTISGKVTIQ